MHNLFKLLFITAIIFISGCRNPVKNENAEINSEIPRGKIELLYLDSIRISKFISHHPSGKLFGENLESFYKKRNNVFVWIDNSGINEYGKNFIHLLEQEETNDKPGTVENDEGLHSLYQIFSKKNYNFNSKDSLTVELELLFSINFFSYAKRNWVGINDEEFKKANWFIDRKKTDYENLLDSVLKGSALGISTFEPVYHQYGMLKKYLIKYRALEKDSSRIVFPDNIKEFKKGDSLAAIFNIRKKLYWMEDLSVNDSSNVFDNEMEDAVIHFQKRHGLKEDGIITRKTLHEINIPVRDRVKQIVINMERCRWVPEEPKGNYLAVNIPDFKLLVYDHDTLLWSCNVIVGKSKTANNTVIFNDYLEYVVFCPYWNIPNNILIKEVLPEIKKNSGYLLSHDMEIIDDAGNPVTVSSIEWNKRVQHFPYIIRQKPGKNNALGLIKFLFPNHYDIYMHDTPEKSLFNETNRAFSHGCIRVEKPYKLAEFLLISDTTWTEEKIDSIIKRGDQTFVKLKNKIPVFITYFTAWVDRNGKLNFRDDVYHHDAEMKDILFPSFE